MSSYASRKEGQLCPNKSYIEIVHAREKAEDAEVAAALRELLPTAELLGTAFYDEMRILLSFLGWRPRIGFDILGLAAADVDLVFER